jgi:hypothetical protein
LPLRLLRPRRGLMFTIEKIDGEWEVITPEGRLRSRIARYTRVSAMREAVRCNNNRK